mgnify:CR=1 FL=1|jgi:hypothetical protein
MSTPAELIQFLGLISSETEEGACFANALADKLDEIASEIAYKLEGSPTCQEVAEVTRMNAGDMRDVASSLSGSAAEMRAYIRVIGS